MSATITRRATVAVLVPAGGGNEGVRSAGNPPPAVVQVPAIAPRRRARSFAAQVFSGAGAISAAGAVVRLLALAAAPLLTRVLGPVPFGTAALIGTLASLLAGFGALGLDLSYSRYFLAATGAERDAVERFCWRLVLLTGCGTSLLGAVVWVAVAAPRTQADPALAWLVAAFVLVTVLTTLSQTRARVRQEYMRVALSVLVSGVVSTGGTVVLALAGWRTASALVAGTLAGLAAGVAVAGVPRPGDLGRASGVSATQRRAVLALGLPNALTTFLFWVMTSADRWTVAWFFPAEVLGTYSFAATLAAAGMMLNGAVIMVWFPEAVRAWEAGGAASREVLGRLWARLVTVLALTWLGIVMVGGDALRLLTDPRFHGGVAYVPWVAGGVFFCGVAQLASTAMVLKKDQRPQAVWWSIGAVACVLLQVVLVPLFGAVAAAAATCLCFALIAAGVLRHGERWMPLRVSWARLASALLLILGAGVVGLGAWSASPLVSLGIKLPVGIAVAALALGWVAPDWVQRAREVAAARLPRIRAVRRSAAVGVSAP